MVNNEGKKRGIKRFAKVSDEYGFIFPMVEREIPINASKKLKTIKPLIISN